MTQAHYDFVYVQRCRRHVKPQEQQWYTGKTLLQTFCGLYPQTLSTILPSTGQNHCFGNILLYETSVISIMVSHFDYQHRCLTALILPSRWQDGAESLGMETTSCLWLHLFKNVEFCLSSSIHSKYVGRRCKPLIGEAKVQNI